MSCVGCTCGCSTCTGVSPPLLVCASCDCTFDPRPQPQPPLTSLQMGRPPNGEPDWPTPSLVHFGLCPGPGGTCSTCLSEEAQLPNAQLPFPPLPLCPRGCSRKSYIWTFWCQTLVRHVWVLPGL